MGLDFGLGVAAHLHLVGSEEFEHIDGELGSFHVLGVLKWGLRVDCCCWEGLDDELHAEGLV